MAAYAAHTTTSKVLISKQNKSHTKEPTFREKTGCVRKQRSGEWTKSKKGSDTNYDRNIQKTKREDIYKWNQTDSPEIPDRGKHQKSPGGTWGQTKQTAQDRVRWRRVVKALCSMGGAKRISHTFGGMRSGQSRKKDKTQ